MDLRHLEMICGDLVVGNEHLWSFVFGICRLQLHNLKLRKVSRWYTVACSV